MQLPSVRVRPCTILKVEGNFDRCAAYWWAKSATVKAYLRSGRRGPLLYLIATPSGRLLICRKKQDSDEVYEFIRKNGISLTHAPIS